MEKRSQLLESLILAPFSALAAAITGPEGDRKRAAGLGALIGAGMAAMAQKEIEARRERGEDVSISDMSPLIKAILGGLAAGGALRVLREQQTRGDVSTRAAIIAGTPAGALIASGNPLVGGIVGAGAASWLARMAGRGDYPSDAERRAREALEAARLRLLMARRAAMAEVLRGRLLGQGVS